MTGEDETADISGRAKPTPADEESTTRGRGNGNGSRRNETMRSHRFRHTATWFNSEFLEEVVASECMSRGHYPGVE
ncbi:hypothetical protein Y032_0269g826 [Ancylostoma ceylanicum]|uniref:Uncharacterized protein n=1 Tax=Ancylostoma ceylanicum TaxID=53326 RepID=A0A016S8U3_9BILA|nr:hypothetical protein Y032_0269g826 [Ancylostoma ceylanicum]